MGYGQGAIMRGAVEGFDQSQRAIEDQASRAEARKTQALQRTRLEGQVADEQTVRTRRQGYETDPAVTGAADAVGYFKAKRDKALKMGDLPEFERTHERVTAEEKKVFTNDFDKAMRKFIGTQGADYKGLVEVYNKHWNDGNTVEMTKNEDGSFDMTVTPKDGEPQVIKAPNWEAVGKTAMRMGDPGAWVKMKDAEAKELLDQKGKEKEIALKGEEERKTVRVRGEEAQKVAKLRAAMGGTKGGGDPAAVRTAKWQIEQLAKATNPATKKPYTESEATQIVLKANKGDITARDKLRHIGALRRNERPGAESNVQGDLDKDIGMATGGATDDPLGLR